jgi:hypothetical protein
VVIWRKKRDRLSIRPGSPAINVTNTTSSNDGTSHRGASRPPSGAISCSTIAVKTAIAIGHRLSALGVTFAAFVLSAAIGLVGLAADTLGRQPHSGVLARRKRHDWQR